MSSADRWNTRNGSIDISPTYIREDTGVSNDMGIGFWLTYDGDAIIGFNTLDGSTLKTDFKDLPVQIPDSPTVGGEPLMRYNRIILWEVSHWLENRANASIRQIAWLNIPLQICDSAPYTYSNIVPPKITWMSRLKEKIFVWG
ncbi:uncharacterized protein A4U43_C08F20130 [Asparagus officinalis]|nr:uncharacterized protein A4U43_C08F20130 [Asparagus officinalis]